MFQKLINAVGRKFTYVENISKEVSLAPMRKVSSIIGRRETKQTGVSLNMGKGIQNSN